MVSIRQRSCAVASSRNTGRDRSSKRRGRGPIAVKAVPTYRGRDPRDCVLLAFGGNGGVFAVELARQLQMRRVLVPRTQLLALFDVAPSPRD